MGILVLSTAFCGKSLRTASLIIAWFSTIFVGVIWSLYLSLLPFFYSVFNNVHGVDVVALGVCSVVGMVLTYFFIEHCLLLWGVIKKQKYFLLPWIVITCFTISIGIGTAIVSLIVVLFLPLGFLVLLPNSLITSCLIYCLLVINSYYRELSNRDSRVENANLRLV